MEKGYGFRKQDDDDGPIDLPPGFRFHPTDEELIRHYLQRKVVDSSFASRAIGDVDLNKSEPWELPWKAKFGEKEWYFFCVRDRKYPTGLRTNRATEVGYWKATGKDKEIYSGKSLVGMKKTLVFYCGRAPKGEKTNWVMHEYRLEGKFSQCHLNLPKASNNEWVICRVFHKTSCIQTGENYGLRPSTDPSPSKLKCSAAAKPVAMAHVPCFSNDAPLFYQPELSYATLPECSLLRVLLESNDGVMNFGTAPSTSAAEADLDFIWGD